MTFAFCSRESENSFELATRKFAKPEDEAVTFVTPSLSRKIERERPKLPENLVALLHWGRSGSGFLHSLIDGHPQVSTLPGHYLAGFFSKDMWGLISSNRADEMIENFIDIYEILFDAAAKSPLGFPIKNLGFNEGYTAMGWNRDQILQLDRKSFATACFLP